jgi:hypothetical protein
MARRGDLSNTPHAMILHNLRRRTRSAQQTQMRSLRALPPHRVGLPHQWYFRQNHATPAPIPPAPLVTKVLLRHALVLDAPHPRRGLPRSAACSAARRTQASTVWTWPWSIV